MRRWFVKIVVVCGVAILAGLLFVSFQQQTEHLTETNPSDPAKANGNQRKLQQENVKIQIGKIPPVKYHDRDQNDSAQDKTGMPENVPVGLVKLPSKDTELTNKSKEETQRNSSDSKSQGKSQTTAAPAKDVTTTIPNVRPRNRTSTIANPLEFINNTTKPKRQLPRVLCWILTDPQQLDKRAIHVKETWAKHCDKMLYMSSKQNDTFPTIGLPVESGRSHLATKSKLAWTYVYDHHLHDYDYFAKGDDDTFLIIENLKRYLQHRDPEEPEFFGHRMYFTEQGKRFTYNSGGPGQILSRNALKIMVERSIRNTSLDCMKDGQGEDWKTAWCLTRAGARSVDTRDSQGKMTFLIFALWMHFDGSDPQWYKDRVADGRLVGYECCSDYPIGFHYVSGSSMRQLYYYTYHLKYRPLADDTVSDEQLQFIEPDGHVTGVFQGPI